MGHGDLLRGIPSHYPYRTMRHVIQVGGTRTYFSVFTSAAPEVPFGLPGRRETANVKRNSGGAEGERKRLTGGPGNSKPNAKGAFGVSVSYGFT